MIISRRQFTNGICIGTAGAFLPTLTNAGGDGGGGSFQNKPSSTSPKSYSKMSAKQLARERNRLIRNINERVEVTRELESDIKRENRKYRNAKAELDQLARAAEKETDPKKKQKLNRQVKKDSRELEQDGFFLGRDIESLDQLGDDLVRLKADLKSVEKWIKYRNATN